MPEKMTDRQKVTEWLKSIGASKDEADEVLELCAMDKEARAYFVGRYDGDCKCKNYILI